MCRRDLHIISELISFVLPLNSDWFASVFLPLLGLVDEILHKTITVYFDTCTVHSSLFVIQQMKAQL